MRKRVSIHGAVYAVSAIMALSLFGDSLLYAVLPLYAERLGIPLFMVGAVLSINRWIRLLSNPLAARSYEKSPIHKPLFYAVVGAILSTAAYAFPWGAAGFLSARVLWGVSLSHLRLGSYLVILETSLPVMGFAMGVMQAISRLASGITVIAGGVFVDFFGYHQGMLVLALLTALALPLIPILRRQLQASARHNAANPGQNQKNPAAAERTMSAEFCYAAAFITHVVGNGLVLSSLSLVIQQRIGDAVTFGSATIGVTVVASLVASTHWLSGIIVGPWGGRAADRFGRRGPFLAVTWGQGLCLFAIVLWNRPWLTIAAAVCFYTLTTLQRLFLNVALSDSAQGSDGNRIIGVYNSAQDLGAAIGPLLGYAAGVHFGFEQVYSVGAAAVLALGLFLPLQQVIRRPQ